MVPAACHVLGGEWRAGPQEVIGDRIGGSERAADRIVESVMQCKKRKRGQTKEQYTRKLTPWARNDESGCCENNRGTGAKIDRVTGAGEQSNHNESPWWGLAEIEPRQFHTK